MLAKNKLVGIEPNRLRRHDLVGFLVHQNTMLMNTGFVSKSIGTDDGFVRLHGYAGDR